MKKTEFSQGTFGYDYNFLQKYHKNLVLLKDPATNAMIALCPDYQGRVMTSSAKGMESHSNGWINSKLIESGKTIRHINAFGGEERFWLGPEGGPFSIYFAPGVKQEFENWQVPAILDTLPFKLDTHTQTQASFSADLDLVNYSGTPLRAKIERNVKLLPLSEIEKTIGIKLPDGINSVAYQSENTITNTGENGWTKQTGGLSIWMLSMFVPSPDVSVLIPFVKGDEKKLGKVVNDDYFGKVPSERLNIGDGIIWFKADGKQRGKIGIPPLRVKEFAGSYDALNKSLTILWCKLPEKPSEYVNSKWGKQDDPFSGDVINSYNDGPVEDGSQMGPFYELESSSPAANLQPGGKLTHTQRIFHFEGAEKDLDEISSRIFNVSISKIKANF